MRAAIISLSTSLLLFGSACGSDRVFNSGVRYDASVGDSSAPLTPNPDAEPALTDSGEAPDAGEMTAPDAEAGPDANPDASAPDAAPALRDPPALRPYSGGTCPTLMGGPTTATPKNSAFMSAGLNREFRVLLPMGYDPALEWPVVFAWHWLNASGDSFVRDGELESAINEMGFIAVLPENLRKANGDKAYLFDWPFVETLHAEEELVFFDDMLTCISEQFNVDQRRVYGIGVSAGALWLTYMMSTDRVNYFAAVESLSGGLGGIAGVWQMTYTPQANKFPAIVLWGGTSDRLGVNFATASQNLRDALLADGHFVVACTHDQGHAIPPITPPPGSNTRFWSLWRFMLDHPYGTDPSPYIAGGLPMGFPDFCSIP